MSHCALPVTENELSESTGFQRSYRPQVPSPGILYETKNYVTSVGYCEQFARFPPADFERLSRNHEMARRDFVPGARQVLGRRVRIWFRQLIGQCGHEQIVVQVTFDVRHQSFAVGVQAARREVGRNFRHFRIGDLDRADSLSGPGGTRSTLSARCSASPVM
jgi:hypothetical protein